MRRTQHHDVMLSSTSRDLDPLEREALDDSGVTLVPDVAARLDAVSVSAWDAEHDTEGVTRRVCMSLLDTLLG